MVRILGVLVSSEIQVKKSEVSEVKNERNDLIHLARSEVKKVKISEFTCFVAQVSEKVENFSENIVEKVELSGSVEKFGLH